VLTGQRIAVWFSCGAASAVAAKLTLERYGEQNEVRVVNSPVAEEPADNRRFLRDCEQWLGVTIEEAVNPKWPAASAVEVWEKRRYMSGVAGAPCTLELKKNARVAWEQINKPDWHVLGFTADEVARHERFTRVPLPDSYARGFDNANCIGCVKAQSPSYWQLVRENYPEAFAARAEQSRRIGARLARVRGVRVFLDELPPPPEGGWRERDLFEAVECGVFCEEPANA